MRLIVGLGNPGTRYQWTPHNMGFLAVDGLAERTGTRVTRREAKSYTGQGELAGQEVILAKPQTMMNLSGLAVRMLLDRCRCDRTDMIVLHDDVDLPWGMLRIRQRGIHSAHNGLKSVIDAVGTDEFIRVRMGVQPPQIWGDRADYVLCPMGKAERQLAGQTVAEAVRAVETILTEGVAKAMSKFNRRVPPAEEELG
jgi:PTH1 family peptidyl-tRNA hydrolase